MDAIPEDRVLQTTAPLLPDTFVGAPHMTMPNHEGDPIQVVTHQILPEEHIEGSHNAALHASEPGHTGGGIPGSGADNHHAGHGATRDSSAGVDGTDGSGYQVDGGCCQRWGMCPDFSNMTTFDIVMMCCKLGGKLFLFFALPWIIMLSSGFHLAAVICGSILMSIGVIASQYQIYILHSFEQQIDKLKSEVTRLDEENMRFAENNKVLEKTNQEFVATNTKLTQNVSELRAVEETLKADAGKISEATETLKSENEELRTQVDKFSSEVNSLSDTSHQLRQQVNLLKNVNSTISNNLVSCATPELVDAFKQKMEQAINDESMFTKLVTPLEKTQKKYELVLRQLEEATEKQERLAEEEERRHEEELERQLAHDRRENQLQDQLERLVKRLENYELFADLVRYAEKKTQEVMNKQKDKAGEHGIRFFDHCLLKEMSQHFDVKILEKFKKLVITSRGDVDDETTADSIISLKNLSRKGSPLHPNVSPLCDGVNHSKYQHAILSKGGTRISGEMRNPLEVSMAAATFRSQRSENTLESTGNASKSFAKSNVRTTQDLDITSSSNTSDGISWSSSGASNARSQPSSRAVSMRGEFIYELRLNAETYPRETREEYVKQELASMSAQDKRDFLSTIVPAWGRVVLASKDNERAAKSSRRLMQPVELIYEREPVPSNYTGRNSSKDPIKAGESGRLSVKTAKTGKDDADTQPPEDDSRSVADDSRSVTDGAKSVGSRSTASSRLAEKMAAVKAQDKKRKKEKQKSTRA